MSSLPAWSHSFVAENVLYTRNFLASNSEVLQDDGSIDLGSASSTPLMIPQDVSAALANAGSTTSSSAMPSMTTAASSTPVPSTGVQNVSNGAGLLMLPKGFISLCVIAVTFLVL